MLDNVVAWCFYLLALCSLNACCDRVWSYCTWLHTNTQWWHVATSIPGSLILGGSKMIDPGNEVGRMSLLVHTFTWRKYSKELRRIRQETSQLWLGFVGYPYYNFMSFYGNGLGNQRIVTELPFMKVIFWSIFHIMSQKRPVYSGYMYSGYHFHSL